MFLRRGGGQGKSAVPIARRRITEVWSDSADGSFGSGYLLGGGLILTARHVVLPEGSGPPTIIKARPLSIAHLVMGLQPVDLVWPDLAQLADPSAPDAALLRLREFVEDTDVGPRLGPPDDDEDGRGTRVSATGFPAFVSQVGPRRDTEEIAGVVFLGTALVAGRYEIKDMTVRDRENLNQELNWHGMSGAALLANGRVIGILIARKSTGQRYDFSAVRIETLLAIPEFANAIREHVEFEGDETETPPAPDIKRLVCLLGQDEQEEEFVDYHGKCLPNGSDRPTARSLLCLLPGAHDFRHCPADLSDRFTFKTLPELSWQRDLQFTWLEWPASSLEPAAALANLRSRLWSLLTPPKEVPPPVEPANYRELLATNRPRLFRTDLTKHNLDLRLAALLSEWARFWAALAPLPDGRPPVHLLLVKATDADETRAWLKQTVGLENVVIEPFTQLLHCNPIDLEKWLGSRVPPCLGPREVPRLDRIARVLRAEFGGAEFFRHNFRTRVEALIGDSAHG